MQHNIKWEQTCHEKEEEGYDSIRVGGLHSKLDKLIVTNPSLNRIHHDFYRVFKSCNPIHYDFYRLCNFMKVITSPNPIYPLNPLYTFCLIPRIVTISLEILYVPNDIFLYLG